MDRLKTSIKQKLPDKLRQKKSPSKKICALKTPLGNRRVHLVYSKYTNILPIAKTKTTRGIFKDDIAGIFTLKSDAENVARCLNNLFIPLSIYDEKYVLNSKYFIMERNIYNQRDNTHSIAYIVIARYGIKKNASFRRKEFTSDILLQVIEDADSSYINQHRRMTEDEKKLETQYLKDLQKQFDRQQKEILEEESTNNTDNKIHSVSDISLDHTFRSIDDLERAKSAAKDYSETREIKRDANVHVVRYRMNDVMPTMNFDDYDIDKHRQNMKKLIGEIQKYPHKKQSVADMKKIIN